MTKHIIASLAAIGFSALVLPTHASAQFKGPGASPSVTSVSDVRNAYDDSYVELEGNIVSKVKDEKYMFRDSSGEIMIEIDDEDFRGQEVRPETKVKIKGEVDKDWNDVTIDVKSIEIVK